MKQRDSSGKEIVLTHICSRPVLNVDVQAFMV
jgi:hypothetical protein